MILHFNERDSQLPHIIGQTDFVARVSFRLIILSVGCHAGSAGGTWIIEPVTTCKMNTNYVKSDMTTTSKSCIIYQLTPFDFSWATSPRKARRCRERSMRSWGRHTCSRWASTSTRWINWSGRKKTYSFSWWAGNSAANSIVLTLFHSPRRPTQYTARRYLIALDIPSSPLLAVGWNRLNSALCTLPVNTKLLV